MCGVLVTKILYCSDQLKETHNAKPIFEGDK